MRLQIMKNIIWQSTISSKIKKKWKIVNFSRHLIWCLRAEYTTFTLQLLTLLTPTWNWLTMKEFITVKDLDFLKFIPNIKMWKMDIFSVLYSEIFTQIQKSLIQLWRTKFYWDKNKLMVKTHMKFGNISNINLQKWENLANSFLSLANCWRVLCKAASNKMLWLLNLDIFQDCFSMKINIKFLSWRNLKSLERLLMNLNKRLHTLNLGWFWQGLNW